MYISCLNDTCLILKHDTFEIALCISRMSGIPSISMRVLARIAKKRVNAGKRGKRGWIGRIRYPGEDIWRSFNNWSRHWRRCGHHSPLSRARRARRSDHQIFRDYKVHTARGMHTLCALPAFVLSAFFQRAYARRFCESHRKRMWQ